MYRDNAIKVLGSVIKNNNNVRKLENKIHSITNNQDEYRLLILEIMENKRKGKSAKEIMSMLKEGSYLENREECVIYKNKIKEHDAFLVKPFEVEEGVLVCGKCNSNRTISYTKQTRSGDESTTVFATCYDCNNVWKI